MPPSSEPKDFSAHFAEESDDEDDHVPAYRPPLPQPSQDEPLNLVKKKQQPLQSIPEAHGTASTSSITGPGGEVSGSREGASGTGPVPSTSHTQPSQWNYAGSRDIRQGYGQSQASHSHPQQQQQQQQQAIHYQTSHQQPAGEQEAWPQEYLDMLDQVFSQNEMRLDTSTLGEISVNEAATILSQQGVPHASVGAEHASDMDYQTHHDSWRGDDYDYSSGSSQAETDEEEAEAQIPTVIDSDDDDEGDERRKGPLKRPQTIVDSSYNSFWQYRKEPKGPQGRTFDISVPVVDNPHEPIKFRDPAFSGGEQLALTHFGKPRVGEGNDMTPNPEKLLHLGNEIEELTQKMSSLGESSSDRKEKMKISSRICRIKRTANHEANKIKLAGLEKERAELSKAIQEVKMRTPSTAQAVEGHTSASPPLQETTEQIIESIYQTKVAGRTGEYVNSVLEKSKPNSRETSD